MNDPFTLLPANLGKLAQLTASVGGRFSLAGVRLEVLGEGWYEAAATDGRRLGIVRGKTDADPLDYPPSPELAELPPSQASAVLTRRDWEETFKQARRCSRSSSSSKEKDPGAGLVAVHLGAERSTLATTDGAEVQTHQVAHVEGRFPDYRAILPKKEPAVRVRVNVDYLISLLEVAREHAANDTVALELFDETLPITIRASTENAATGGSREFTGLLMPLT